jgi:protein-disulfide isomerase
MSRMSRKQPNRSSRKQQPQQKKSSMAKPAVIILIAVVIAGGAALYFSRQQPPAPNASSAAPAGQSSPLPAPLANTPRVQLAPRGGQVRGSSGAAITLIEFGDYQCPTCAAFSPVVNQVLRQHADQVRLEFHYYPLGSIHRNAMAAAIAAESAAEQNRFWEMHDLLFERQPSWANAPDPKAEFLAYAKQVGLDVDKFSQSMNSPAVQQKVLEDLNRAQRLNLNEVPTFFVNGYRLLLPAANPEALWQVVQQTAARP